MPAAMDGSRQILFFNSEGYFTDYLYQTNDPGSVPDCYAGTGIWNINGVNCYPWRGYSAPNDYPENGRSGFAPKYGTYRMLEISSWPADSGNNCWTAPDNPSGMSPDYRGGDLSFDCWKSMIIANGLYVGDATYTYNPPDITAPVIAQSFDIATQATSSDGISVDYLVPTATDDVDGTDSVLCTPPSGSFFAIGTSTISCTATDAAGNTATSTFEVIVQDATASMPTNSSPSPQTSVSNGSIGIFPVLASGSGAGALSPVIVATSTATSSTLVAQASSTSFAVIASTTHRISLALHHQKTDIPSHISAPAIPNFSQAAAVVAAPSTGIGAWLWAVIHKLFGMR